MYITLLKIEGFRNLEVVEMLPARGLNYLYGENGAGKTSVLEALYLLSRGKSFRTPASEELIGTGSSQFRVFLESRYGAEADRIGLERSNKQWKARRNGQDVTQLSELSRTLPIVLMEPNSHTLVSGGPEARRRFLDWGVFHVEPLFLDTWRRYNRGLKQRNAALRRRQIEVLDSLDNILAPLGERLNAYRQNYFEQLAAVFSAQVSSQRAGLADIGMHFQSGWKESSLVESLQAGRARDLEQGLSRHGPHRADLLLERAGRPLKSLLSRGEQKRLAACLLLSQAQLLQAGGERPVILLDDLASEFDQQHFREVLDQAQACAEQVWVTGVQAPEQRDGAAAVFHVEHGKVLKVV